MYPDFYNSPPTGEHQKKAVDWLRTQYRQLKVFPIGKSVLDREIEALCIGNPMGATLFVGATHGLEWLTSLLLFRFCEEILQGLDSGGAVSDIDVGRAFHNRSLVIIPCLNPDGVEIALRGKEGAGALADQVEAICGGQYGCWQANANGVDLNHNFDAGWRYLKKLELAEGIHAPAPTRFGGEKPGSEPETKAIMGFCQNYQPRALYSFHSQGEEIYYRYGKHTPARSKLMAQILASSSGYATAQPTGLASHGGLKDWFIDKYCRPGFTIEIGKGKNPLPVEMLEKVYAQTEEMLMLATLL